MKPVALFALAGRMLADALPAGPLAEAGPFLNLGLGGVILWIWWQERKERRERQAEDDKRYGELLAKLIAVLERK